MTDNAIIDAPLLSEDDKEELDLQEDAKKEEREFLDEFDLNDDVHEYYARIYRVLGGKQIYIEQVGPEAFPILDRLRKVHKGGKFRAILFKDKKIFKNKTYDIEPLSDEIAPVQNSQISDVASLLKTHTEQMAAMMQGAIPNSEPRDPIEQMTALMTALGAAKEFFAPAKEKDNTIEMLLKGIEIARETANPSGERNLYDVIGDVLKSPIAEKIGTALEAQNNATLKIPAQATISERKAPAINENTQYAEPLPEILKHFPPEQIEQFRQHILYLENRALNNSDPDLYADLLIDQFAPEYVQFFIMNNQIEEIIRYFAPNAPMPWFQQLIFSIREALTPSPETGDNANMATNTGNSAFRSAFTEPPASNVDGHSAGSGGNSGNAETNAGTDKAG